MAATMVKTSVPGIYKRGGRYVVVWRYRGKQHKSFHRTMAEAREAQGKRRQNASRRPEARTGFEDYANEWLTNYRGRTVSGLGELTRADYRRSLDKYLIPHFRGFRFADVEPRDVRALIGSLERQERAPGSIRKTIAPLRAMYATAFEDGDVAINPTAGVRVTGQSEREEREIRSLTRKELAVLLNAFPADWRLFFEFLAHTGLRISEALGLTWDNIEFGDRPQIAVRWQLSGTSKKKGPQRRTLKSEHSRRDIPLSPRMAAALWDVGADQPGGTPVFASGIGTPLQASNVRRRVLKPARESVGLEWVGFHTFRHTCASLLFDGGKTIKQVQEWLGHADPGFTLRTYVHLMDDGLGDADFLDTAVAVPVGELLERA